LPASISAFFGVAHDSSAPNALALACRPRSASHMADGGANAIAMGEWFMWLARLLYADAAGKVKSQSHGRIRLNTKTHVQGLLAHGAHLPLMAPHAHSNPSR
jgi:hypothetical protein